MSEEITLPQLSFEKKGDGYFQLRCEKCGDFDRVPWKGVRSNVNSKLWKVAGAHNTMHLNELSPEDRKKYLKQMDEAIAENQRKSAEKMKDKNRPEDQPMPTTSEQSRDVQQELVRMVQERRQLGIQRYGSPLMTHNGRDALQDALEEAVDLAAYLMQMKMERDDAKAEKTPYQYLLTFVSDNFSVTKSDISHEHTLWCKSCGDLEVHEYGPDLVPGERTMMRSIGLHMDLVDHPGYQKTGFDPGNPDQRFDGGEGWMEEFETVNNHLTHMHCSWTLEIVVENLREQLQLAYNHLEECQGHPQECDGK